MNVGIDITSVIYGRGVSRYTSNLIRALAKRKDINLSLYGSSFRQYRELESFVNDSHFLAADSKIQKYPPSILSKLWQLGLNPIKKQLPGLDVFHSWDWLQPPDQGLPLVSTIHDLAILKYPETAHPKILSMHQHSWQTLKKKNAHIIAVSRSTKKDIVELLQIPSSHVHIVYEALPQETVRVTEALTEEKYEYLKNQLQLTQPFLFFVGTREPRKNLQRLIQAWLPLARDYQLIIAGETGWDGTSAPNSLTRHPNLRFLGKVTNQQLAVLYEEASCFVYPSLYEGFGLPILEAFYHGTPVVASNISSMPEVAGNAAELVDPLDINSIKQGIEKIINESRADQQQRMQRMILRLHLFDWQKVADETIQVYKLAAEAGT
jgi:glycosyltransferase involved in cell wall biosynthesis